MNKTLKGLFIFVLGVAAGGAGGYFFAKQQYEEKIQKEIQELRKVRTKMNAKYEEPTKPDEAESQDRFVKAKPPIFEYQAEIQKNSYKDYSNVEDGVAKTIEREKEEKKPYVIPPEEFAETEGYDVITLTYFTDGVLADNDDTIMEDVDNTVGLDSLNRFGEYEDDSVFVRNDRLKCDFEILLSQKSYKDFIQTKPYLAED